MVYTVNWVSGMIGGQYVVKVGGKYENTPLNEALADLIGEKEGLRADLIRITSAKKKRGSKSFGIGTPQSSRDR